MKSTKTIITGLLVAGAALVPVSAAGASQKTPAMPTQQQVNSCVKTVTGHKPLTVKQTEGCWTAVWQTGLDTLCNGNPGDNGPHDVYVIDLKGYRGISGKAAHSWAIHAGARPFQVTGADSPSTINAALCNGK
jgi:hypothetical protein